MTCPRVWATKCQSQDLNSGSQAHVLNSFALLPFHKHIKTLLVTHNVSRGRQCVHQGPGFYNPSALPSSASCFLSLVHSLMDTRWLPQLKHHINSQSSSNAGSRRVNRCHERHCIFPFFFFSDITLSPNVPFPLTAPHLQSKCPLTSHYSSDMGYMVTPSCTGIWKPKHWPFQPLALSEWMSECFWAVWYSPKTLILSLSLSLSPGFFPLLLYDNITSG